MNYCSSCLHYKHAEEVWPDHCSLDDRQVLPDYFACKAFKRERDEKPDCGACFYFDDLYGGGMGRCASQRKEVRAGNASCSFFEDLDQAAPVAAEEVDHG